MRWLKLIAVEVEEGVDILEAIVIIEAVLIVSSDIYKVDGERIECKNGVRRGRFY